MRTSKLIAPIYTVLLATSTSSPSHAASPESNTMELCIPEQSAALELALNKPSIAPKDVLVTLERGDCRQIEKGRLLAFAVFFPLKPIPDFKNVSREDLIEWDFKLLAGLFDLNRRRIVAIYTEPFPWSGWIEMYDHRAYVNPTFYNSGKMAAFAISHGNERSPNAADSHASNTLTLLMRDRASLKPVLARIPIESAVALTQGGGICCAHVVLQVARTLMPTTRRTFGMPDLELRAERDLVVDEREGPLPEGFPMAPKTYSYKLQFDGHSYRASRSKPKDPWDDLDR
ncbi:MAG: hypothetical protein Q7J66_03140 [Hydrogenophaga sp.]|nr:hypothetical protein [Hydrogenophaga sp.]